MAKKIKTKARKQEILQWRIDYLTQKVANFILYGISTRKIDKLNIKKTKFNNSKAIVDAS
jgi:hypothetical protein